MTLALARDQALSVAAGGGDLHRLEIVVTAVGVDATVAQTIDALRRAGATPGVEVRIGAVTTDDAERLASADIVIFDAQAAGALTDQLRYRFRTISTEIRARRQDVRIGLELPESAPSEPSIASLLPYIDFVVVPNSIMPGAMTTPAGVDTWIGTSAADDADPLSVAAAVSPPPSDHLLVHVAGGGQRLAASIAELRDVLPAGLTPLPEVTVACDAGCEAATYLNPNTLEAVALVYPSAPVTRLTVKPAALDVEVYGAVQARARGPEVQVPPISTAVVLRIRGWRGVAGDAFAAGVEVTGARQLRVDEIIARHQAARARQRSAVRSVISSGTTVLTFRVTGFAGPLTVTARTVSYSRGNLVEIEQNDIQVNGLDVQRARGDVPRLPLIEPERVSTPPLTISFTDAYRYVLRGQDTISGRATYVVGFEPVRSNESLFSGTAWIDRMEFSLVKVDAVQTALRGPITSSRQVDYFEPVPLGEAIVWLPQRSAVFQIYQGPTESTPIRRETTYSQHEVNASDFMARLDAAHRSEAVMLRDTAQGFRFLVRTPGTAAGGEVRRLATEAVDHVATAIAGSLFDPNISVPLVFAGISYIDFNLLKTGAQLNAFFGGTFGRLSWSTAPLFGNGWRVTGGGSAVAVSYNDRAIARGVERYAENVRQRPAQVTVALVGPLAPALRLRASYDLNYTVYKRSDTTDPRFVVPASTPVHAARLTLEAEHGAWSATAWWSAARRQRWTAWGFPSADAPVAREFERVGATLARSFMWSPRAVGHVDAAWMSGRNLDRFSQFAFGTFDNTLRGYPAVSIRYTSGAVVRSVATWSANARVRFDGFADLGLVHPFEEPRWRAYPGFGTAAESPIGLGWLLAVEWGYGVKGVTTTGATGTHVVRISGYKIF